MDSPLFFFGSLALAIIVIAVFWYRIFDRRRQRRHVLTTIIQHVFPGADINYVYHSSRKKGAFDPAGLTCQVAGEDFALSIARRNSWSPSTGIFKKTPLPIAVMMLPVNARDFSNFKRVAGFMGLRVFPEFTGKFGALAKSHEALDQLKSLASWRDFASLLQSDPQLTAVYFLGSSEGLFSTFFAACGSAGILVARSGEAAVTDQSIIATYCKLLKSLEEELNPK